MCDKKPVIAVIGPTASGKTELAVNIAKHFNGEVISGDSMQIYKEMSIGTAKPTIEEMQGIEHHLVDFLEPDKTFSVVDYVNMAKEEISKIYSKNKLPIVAGGTGLYIDSLLLNSSFLEVESDPNVRSMLEERLQNEGPKMLYEELMGIDPERAKSLHPNNTVRVLRALEVYYISGKTMTEHNALQKKANSPYNILWFGITYKNRDLLYERINKRVDDMISRGLLDETKMLREKGFSKTAAQAIGYKELFDFLDGKQSMEEAIERLKQETRRYAKRQLTWFRRNPSILWVYRDETPDFSEYVINQLKSYF